MSAPKRQAAAAEIFNQQNIMKEEDAYSGEMNDFLSMADEDDGVILESRDAQATGTANAPYPASVPAPIQAQASHFGGPSGGAPRSRRAPEAKKSAAPLFSMKTSEELQLEKEPIQVRETGFWLWKRVIVPPNAYVVHTRLGRKEPVTLGLGVSFRYNPNTDAYLVVPAAMQTIGIVANSISKEKQGVNVLAYVQWQISNFSIAYRKLDLSDPRDPLGIVNAQLREQAEAAIKDKIATMSVEDVLADKAPIIEELTRRLSQVSQGRYEDSADSEGLGIKIVTVQIKEARVSSQRLWENLQAPYRHEQEKEARLSYLQMQERIRSRELATRQVTETSEAEAQVEIERIKQSKQTEGLELRLVEEQKRYSQEQTTARQRIQLQEETTRVSEESKRRLEIERARLEQEARLAALERQQEEVIARARTDAEAEAQQKVLRVEQRLRELAEEQRLAAHIATLEQERFQREEALKQVEHSYLQRVQAFEAEREQLATNERLTRERQISLAQLDLQEAANQTHFHQQEFDAQIARLYQEIRNLTNDRGLERLFIEKMPELASHMPDIQEMRVLQTGDAPTSLNAVIGGFLTLFDSLRDSMRREGVTKDLT